jgi:hypothetical protein
MELRNANLWLPIAFAAVVSEATPMSSLRELPESLQQINFQMDSLRIPEHSLRGVLVLTVAYFPVFTALVVLAAFCACLAVTRTFSSRRFLCGLPAALVVLFLGYIGVISLLVFSSVHLPQPIFYYVILRMPMFLGLVLALWIASTAQKRSTKGAKFKFQTGLT